MTEPIVTKGPVTGTHYGDPNLEITTSDGYMDIQAVVSNSKSPNATSNIALINSNGALSSAFYLSSPFTGSVFNVNTTSNSLIILTFPSAPTSLPFSVLNLRGSTTNAGINVTLHPSFEGTITLTTTGSGNVPVLNVNTSVQDPSGLGRTRYVNGPNVIGNTLTASVGWGQASGPGSVNLNTTNSGSVVCYL